MKYITRILSIGGWAAAALGAIMLLMTTPGTTYADTQWNVGVSGGDHGIDGFHLSIGEYYDVPEREVVVVHDRGIDDDELPVVFFLARRAHVPPEAIVDLRIRGMSWMDITFHFGLEPDIYYVPVTVYEERHYPHGNAWGYYGKYHKKGDWRRIRLSDNDVVNQVNLGFMRNHYRYNPDRVMRYRSEGKRFAAIDREIWRERHGQSRENYYTNPEWRHGNKGNWDKGQKNYSYQGQGKKPSVIKEKAHGNGNKGKDGHNSWQEEGNGGKGHKK
jgi:hypothetical protein